jgi:acetoin utilization deacetylase AcuC-like enzyme
VGLYLRHPSSLRHDTGPHPENAERIVAIEQRLAAAGWPGLRLLEPAPAPREWLERVHTDAHVERIERLCEAGGGMIDMDTVAVAESWEAALHAAGAAGEAAERLLSGEESYAFCGLRPPGHHAESGRAMGFCLFNNAAVAAAHARAGCGCERVLILDWDVHHGNGTEEIFFADPDVLYASIHQSPLYPGTGAIEARGSGEGVGATVNLPVAAGSDGETFAALLQHLIVPIARDWRPGLVVVSAGYDAHRDDPLAQCLLSARDYGELAATVGSLAAELEVPMLFVLEGGYALEALAESVEETLTALAGGRSAEAADPALAAELRRRHAAAWPQALG